MSRPTTVHSAAHPALIPKRGPLRKIAARDAIADCIETELLPSLQSLLPYILLLIKTAPMVGLLGTVDGMVMSFVKIANSDVTPKPRELAQGISTALVTTLVGLVLAIPAIIAFNLRKNRITRLVLEVSLMSMQSDVRVRDDGQEVTRPERRRRLEGVTHENWHRLHPTCEIDYTPMIDMTIQLI